MIVSTIFEVLRLKAFLVQEPNWAKILRVFYLEDGEGYRRAEGNLPEDHDLVLRADVDRDQADEAIAFLRDQGLIDAEWYGGSEDGEGTSEATHIRYQLTGKGFDVAHERELTNRQDQTNRMLLIVTVGLLAAALLQGMASSLAVDPPQQELMAGGSVALLVVVAAFMYNIYRQGFL